MHGNVHGGQQCVGTGHQGGERGWDGRRKEQSRKRARLWELSGNADSVESAAAESAAAESGSSGIHMADSRG